MSNDGEYLLILNRRKPGELQRFPLKIFEENRRRKLSKEMLEGLSHTEQLLASSLLLMEIMGKRGRRVPVLIPKLALDALDLLCTKRTSSGVPKTNKYLFGVQKKRLHTVG